MVNQISNQDWEKIVNDLDLGEIESIKRVFNSKTTDYKSKNITELMVRNTENYISKYIFNNLGLANFSYDGSLESLEFEYDNPTYMYYVHDNAVKINKEFFRAIINKENELELPEEKKLKKFLPNLEKTIKDLEVKLEKSNRKLDSPMCFGKLKKGILHKLSLYCTISYGMQDVYDFIKAQYKTSEIEAPEQE